MFPGCLGADGRLRIRVGAPVSPSFNHGVAFDVDFVYASNGPPTNFVNGLPVTALGELCVEAAAIGHYQNGLPFTAAQNLSINTNVPTSFVNGLPFESGQLSTVAV